MKRWFRKIVKTNIIISFASLIISKGVTMMSIHRKRVSSIWECRLLSRGFICTMITAIVFGCAAFDPKPAGTPVFRDAGKEGAMSSLPHYFIEAPDIISVEVVHMVPKAPYLLRSFDVIGLSVIGTLPDEDLNGAYEVDPSGMIQLGSNYGTVKVSGMSMEEAQRAIEEHLRKRLRDPEVSGQLLRMSEIQQINSNHLVAPDGYITLGSYGRVYVQGLTVDECKEAVEFHLSKELEHPIVAIDIFSFNSKKYYVIIQGAGMGDQVFPFPYTGNEKVLDAIANVNGLTQFSSKRLWIARPVGNSHKPVILPVDWNATVAYGSPHTNYQIYPGDRVFVAEDKMVRADNVLAKTFAPFERIMGFMLLGASTVSRFSGNVLGGGGERGAYGGNY